MSGAGEHICINAAQAVLSKVYSLIAQLVEQMTVNHWVRGSSPRQGAIFKEFTLV